MSWQYRKQRLKSSDLSRRNSSGLYVLLYHRGVTIVVAVMATLSLLDTVIRLTGMAFSM